MKLKSGHITSVQRIPFTIECGHLCQTSQDARIIVPLAACQRNAIRRRADSGPRLDSGWIYSRINYQIKTSLPVVMGNHIHEWTILRMYKKQTG